MHIKCTYWKPNCKNSLYYNDVKWTPCIVSNHRSFDRLFNSWCRPTSKKLQSERWIPTQRASNAEKPSITFSYSVAYICNQKSVQGDLMCFCRFGLVPFQTESDTHDRITWNISHIWHIQKLCPLFCCISPAHKGCPMQSHWVCFKVPIYNDSASIK